MRPGPSRPDAAQDRYGSRQGVPAREWTTPESLPVLRRESGVSEEPPPAEKGPGHHRQIRVVSAEHLVGSLAVEHYLHAGSVRALEDEPLHHDARGAERLILLACHDGDSRDPTWSAGGLTYVMRKEVRAATSSM